MFSQIYQGYEATRRKTEAEQREIDRANGELAAALASVGRLLGRHRQSPRRSRRHGVSAVPAPRLPAEMECCGRVS